MNDSAVDASLRGARRVRPALLLSGLLLLICMAGACKSPFSLQPSSPSSAKTSEKKHKDRSGDGAGTSGRANVIATLEDAAIVESSGLVASRRNPELFWTHNDSGDGPFIYAFDRQGKRRGVWRVSGAKARDWEDIAIGPGPKSGSPYLYVGDIGDNQREREEIVVYRFPEPEIVAGDAASSKTSPRLTETADAIRLQYPDGPHNSEALMVHPLTGDIYIATKTKNESTVIYKSGATSSTSNVNTLVRVGALSIPGAFGAMITGGDISPDGRRVVLCDYLDAYELRLGADSTASFDAIWNQAVEPLSLGFRGQGEAVCYSLDGAAILATSEGRNSPLIEMKLDPTAPSSAGE